MILRKCGYFEDKKIVEELIMHEILGGQFWEPKLMWLNAKIGGEERMEFASIEVPAIQMLIEVANKFVRGKIEKYIVIAAVLLFILTNGFIIYSSLATG